MTSPAPTPPPVSRSFSQQQTVTQSHLGVQSKHQHSHSHSGAPSSNNGMPSMGRQSPASATLQPNRDTNKFRASVDAARNTSGTYYAPKGARPTSEMLPGAMGQGDPETDAIDRWFEDLQHYEQTLEEMAAASLDQNFKEELGAIEQWFRVLSEAERTAALYSLLQSSTQVQIRFFITVLQQMARCDPSNAALFSPSNPQQASMEAQMEAKLASMGLKSPASPVVRQFARQSLGANANNEGGNYLSPASALNMDNDLLASQRAKMKAQAHRISAPGTLSSSNNFGSNSTGGGSNLWGGLAPEAIAESVRSSSPVSQRPKSTGSEYGVSAGNTANNLMRSPRAGATSFEELSPMVGGGSWASMVNTPVVPMFSQSETNGEPPLSPRFDGQGVNNALSGWNNVATSQSGSNNPNLVLDDAKKFRRPGRPSGNGSPANSYTSDSSRRAVSGGSTQQRNMPSSPNLGGSQNMLSPQQAAALSAQQNWRSVNGLLSSSTNNSNSGTPITGNMSPADMANALLMQQQQMQQQMQAQLQLQQNLMAMNGMNGMNGMGLSNMNMLSPGFNGGNMGFPNTSNSMNSPGMSPGGRNAGGRSPRLGGPMSSANRAAPTPVAGSGSNPDEVVDVALLNDISGWMRSLRLHKYTPNFEGSRWQDMVKMDEAALEAKGVSAQGARRKLLKVFENVRVQIWGEERPAGSTGADAGDTSVDA